MPRRFELSGPRFFEADDLLREAVRAAGGHGYAQLPSELEANAASAAYAARMLTGAELAELRAVPECAALLDGSRPPSTWSRRPSSASTPPAPTSSAPPAPRGMPPRGAAPLSRTARSSPRSNPPCPD